MKKLYFLAIVALGAAVMSSCVKDPKECINCAQGIEKKTYIIDTVSGNTITIYPVLTPRNYDFCDSFVLYNGAFWEPYRVPQYQGKLFLCSKEAAVDTARRYREMGDVSKQPCVCRENPDKKFNDTDGKPKNEYLHIDGIKNYPYSVMHLRTIGDTTKIRTYFNYDNENDVFNGLILQDQNTPVERSKMLRSGVYEAELIFYKDDKLQVHLGEPIKFKFAIIRSDKVPNINCLKQARDPDDTVLLK